MTMFLVTTDEPLYLVNSNQNNDQYNSSTLYFTSFIMYNSKALLHLSQIISHFYMEQQG